MTDNGPENTSELSPAPAPNNHAEDATLSHTLAKWTRWTFLGEDGLRAGWKLLIFAAVLVIIVVAIQPLTRLLPKHDPSRMTAQRMAIQEWLAFGVVSLASFLMIRVFDRKPWREYGLPPCRAFSPVFWVGAMLGFGGMALQLFVMHLGGWFEFGSQQLHGAEMFKMGAWWALMFLGVGFFEEFVFRGYAQRVLTLGTGFWIASLLTAGFFAFAHTGNGGENKFGIIMVFLDGLLMCFSLWKTGDLWFAVGQHMAWDWAETFFFGVPNSGTTAVGALRAPSFHGPVLLSGGSVGPEGSITVLIPLALTAVLIAILYRKPRGAAANSGEKNGIVPLSASIQEPLE